MSTPLHRPPAPLPPAGLSRRHALALAASAWTATWSATAWAAPATSAAGRSTAAPSPSLPLPPGFWAQTFERPEGGQLALASLRGKPLLINFWATWCPPCVKEMPELDRFHRAFAPKGWQVVGLAIDGPTPVKAFLSKVRVGFAIGLAGMDGTDLAAQLGNDAGGLPYTVLISPDGRIVQRKLGGTHYADLAAWAAALK